ncbi:DUF2785 domain-containing protein [Vallitalea okinawensis]|uniref:DUF2785 domain-containing protein n=1 Tax=Vallitalea okinawensis TaxID=2078660 RepID=UPI000CFD8D8A|nr:DUF2785 domain-containing protein [Vallitalea okinawensis]
MNEKQLKEKLQQMKENEWALLSGDDPYELTIEMMLHIGSTDPELRDHLILECLWTIIDSGDLSHLQLKELLNLCLSEKHLFYDLGNAEGDGVFNRAFTVLIIAGIIEFHNENDEKLLSEPQVKEVFKQLVKYVENEKDKREYVEVKGWADAIGHWALTFAELVECSAVNVEMQRQTLSLVQNLVCNNDIAYCQDEDERFTTIVMNIINRNTIEENELQDWINSFETMKLPENFLERYNIRTNRKNFLRSLYFRLVYAKESEVLIKRLEEIILTINPYNR